jgi:hypothetical protein
MTENVPSAVSEASAAITTDASPVVAPASVANLTATLKADYEALQNDLEQAQELAADFQKQLAGKSNEVAHFKTLVEKTQLDLVRMEGHIVELRQERHRLANEAMVATGLQSKLELMTRERDHFRLEAHALRNALSASEGEFQKRLKLQDEEVTRLRRAFEILRARHIAAVRPPSERTAPASGDEELIDITVVS